MPCTNGVDRVLVKPFIASVQTAHNTSNYEYRASATQYALTASIASNNTPTLYNYTFPGWTITAAAGKTIGTTKGTSSFLLYPDRTYIQDNTRLITFAQNVTNVNPKSVGAFINLGISIGNGNHANYARGYATLIIVNYNGVQYAQILTSIRSDTIANITYSDATGSHSTMIINYTFYDWKIFLPDTVSNSGKLEIVFSPQNTTIYGADDFNKYTASIVACPVVISGFVHNDNNAMIDSVSGNIMSGITVQLLDAAGVNVL